MLILNADDHPLMNRMPGPIRRCEAGAAPARQAQLRTLDMVWLRFGCMHDVHTH